MKKPRPSAISQSIRERALAGLKLAEAFIQQGNAEVGDEARELKDALAEEGQRIARESRALVFGFVSDEFTPVELFKPWASKSRFQQWRKADGLDVPVIHGRLCVKPSAFIAHWRTLPDETKSRKQPGQADQRLPGT